MSDKTETLFHVLNRIRETLHAAYDDADLPTGEDLKTYWQGLVEKLGKDHETAELCGIHFPEHVRDLRPRYKKRTKISFVSLGMNAPPRAPYKPPELPPWYSYKQAREHFRHALGLACGEIAQAIMKNPDADKIIVKSASEPTKKSTAPELRSPAAVLIDTATGRIFEVFDDGRKEKTARIGFTKEIEKALTRLLELHLEHRSPIIPTETFDAEENIQTWDRLQDNLSNQCEKLNYTWRSFAYKVRGQGVRIGDKVKPTSSTEVSRIFLNPASIDNQGEIPDENR